MEQSGGGACQGNEILLEGVALVVIGIGEEAAAKRDEMVHIGNSAPIKVWELYYEVLARE